MNPLDQYAASLGLRGDESPSAELLGGLQAAHLSTYVYDNLDIMLDQPQPVDATSTATRIASGGRVGYCFHHNSLFAALLELIGFQVERWTGVVWSTPQERPGPTNHLALIVRGLPSVANPEGSWWADPGFGDGPPQPFALVEGRQRVAENDFELHRRGSGWSLRHTPGGGFTGCDITPAEPDVVAAHQRLSTQQGGHFTTLLAMLKVVPRGSTYVVDMVTGGWQQQLRQGAKPHCVLPDQATWWQAVNDLGVPTGDIDQNAQDRLWLKVLQQDQRWADALG